MSADPKNTRPPCEWRDLVWSFALGSTTERENAGLSEHLLEGCGRCGAELEQARVAIGELDLAVVERELSRNPGAAPPAKLRERMHESIQGVVPGMQSPAAPPDPAGIAPNALPAKLPGIALVPGSMENGWVESGIAGIEVRVLVRDLEQRYTTSLLRMAPGATYPAHTHAGREQLYLLSGDVCCGADRLAVGDFQIAEVGSMHPAHTTEQGCLVLIVASLDNAIEA